jgi:hypothetical protein
VAPVVGAVYVNTCYALEDCAQRVARGFDDVSEHRAAFAPSTSLPSTLTVKTLFN